MDNDFTENGKDCSHDNNYINAIIVYSILQAEDDNGTDVENIIANSDCIDHSIMNYEEFSNGLNYLMEINIVKEENKKIICT
ncbi:hypothetical protein ACYULU_14045 [Breznakiellaceae bacterium SP9]